jgi:hypothetical protein
VQARKVLLSAIVGALCLTAAIAVVVLLSGHFDETSWRILGTTSAISFFGLLAVPVGMLLERGQAVALARISAALTAVAFALTLAVIWRHHWATGIGRTWGVVCTLAVAAAQAAAVEARRRENDTRAISALTRGSMVTGGVLAAMGVLAILTEIANGTFYRALGAVAVIDVALIAIVAVLRRGIGPIAQGHRIRINGELIEAPGRDFASAVAAAIRSAESEGQVVKRIERV